MNRDDLLARLHGFEWSDFECKKASRGVPDDAYKTVAAFANTAGGWLVFGVSEHNCQLEVTGVDEPDRVQNDFLSTLRSGQKLNQIIRVEEQRYSIDGKTAFTHHWNYITEQQGQMLPCRAGVLLFGQRQYVEQPLPRPVLDYQRIDTAFDNWSADQRWHDRYVFEENIFSTWRGLVARYMRIAEHPFSLDPATLRRNDDPPDYVAFREAAINLLVHQDYGDPGRKAAIKLFTDRTVFWNPGDAFPATAALLEPTEKDVRNPALVKAFRRIGLSDQAGTGIRAIFRNWHELGRVPPQIRNDKASKEFELVLVNKPLLTVAMQRFRQSLGVNLTPEQADVLALALERPEGMRLSLTDIRALGISTTAHAKLVAGHLVEQQLLEPVGETQFQAPDALRVRFATAAERATEQVTGEVWRLLAVMTSDMKRAEIQLALGLKHEDHFREAYLLPALAANVIAMTQPDKPRSSKQRYRLTERGTAVLAAQQPRDTVP
jgi:ATP-dependent DNA helicase RecG